jgi:hypothetical protein
MMSIVFLDISIDNFILFLFFLSKSQIMGFSHSEISCKPKLMVVKKIKYAQHGSYLPLLCRKRKSISTGAQYVTPDSTIYCGKVKMCRFSSGNWLFCNKFVYLAVAVKRAHSCAPPKKSVINWTWLRLSISDWSIIMIGPGGLLLVVPMNMQFQLQFYCWGCPKQTAKLKHLIFLSRVTYWALVEMV